MILKDMFFRLLNAIFLIAICVGYAGVALGLTGFINSGNASLVTLVAGAVACVDVGIYFVLSYDAITRHSAD
jgi:hypothetical protein